MPKLQVVCQQNSGISYHRLVNPLTYLDMGSDWTIELLWFGQDEYKIDCDVLWYSKYLMMDVSEVKKIQAGGTKVIVDIDDNPHLPLSHPRYKDWVKAGRDIATIENLKIADIVTCSTMKIQELVRQYNKNTVVIPNALPYGQGMYQPKEQPEHEKMTFIYSGGVTHYQDVKLMEGKFRRIGSDPWMKKDTEYLLAGYVPQQKKHYKTKQDQLAMNENYVLSQSRGDWDKMASVFKQTNSYRILPSLPLNEYIQYYEQADVSLIPLTTQSWNTYKSVLKVMEAATKHLPAICSKVDPYWGELKEYDGITWVENNDWYTNIKNHARNRQWSKEQGITLAEQVWKNYNLFTINDIRKQLLNRLV